MRLIGLLRRLAREYEIQGYLIALVHNGPRTGRHLADMKLQHAGDIPEILVGAGDEFLDGVRLSWIGPENNNVR